MSSPFLIWPLTLAALAAAEPSTPDTHHGLTAVPGVKVGHATLDERPTGCTVVLVEAGATAGVDVRGGAPGTREISLLDPVKSVQKVHALVLSGGSAFGLDTAAGVMRFLEERGVGFETAVARVPIVPAAILFDLALGDPKIRPGADAGYKAARAASSDPVAEGNVGAGAGATVGKMRGMESAMKGGLGSSAARLESGLVIATLVAVNAVGDIVDPSDGSVIAGVRGEGGTTLADARRLLRRGSQRRGPEKRQPRPGENTTIGVVATNARLTQAEATKVAQMAQDGLARTIYPAHTPWDGDTIFVIATGEIEGESDLATLGALAAEVMAEAVVRAVLAAESLPGLPSARDMVARAKAASDSGTSAPP